MSRKHLEIKKTFFLPPPPPPFFCTLSPSVPPPPPPCLPSSLPSPPSPFPPLPLFLHPLNFSPTQAQYVFLHDAILEGVTSGNTEVSAERLAQRMSELEEVDSDGETGYQKEFNVRRFICLSTFPFCLCLFLLKVDLFVVTSLCSVFVSSGSMCESSQTQMMMPTSSRIALPMPSHVSHIPSHLSSWLHSLHLSFKT